MVFTGVIFVLDPVVKMQAVRIKGNGVKAEIWGVKRRGDFLLGKRRAGFSSQALTHQA